MAARASVRTTETCLEPQPRSRSGPSGTIALTLIRHVPLNDALAGLDPSSAAAVDTWARYVSGWTGWNHVRAAAALAAAVAFTGARGG